MPVGASQLTFGAVVDRGIRYSYVYFWLEGDYLHAGLQLCSNIIHETIAKPVTALARSVSSSSCLPVVC